MGARNFNAGVNLRFIGIPFEGMGAGWGGGGEGSGVIFLVDISQKLGEASAVWATWSDSDLSLPYLRPLTNDRNRGRLEVTCFVNVKIR